MIHGKKVVVVMPAYKAEQTLEQTCLAIPEDIVDIIILVDDASDDKTVETAERLGLKTFIHEQNLGYGANQKTCYREALRLEADIVIMLHPDYQYDPRLVTAMAAMLASEVYDVALGSRIIGGSPLRGGMPLYKYLSNRFLTLIQNLFLGAKLSEYHTGYRAFTAEVLGELPILANSDDFVFDNQMLTQAIAFGFRIGEISCPTKYFPEASSISFYRSVEYGIGVLKNSMLYRLWKWGIIHSQIFDKKGTYHHTLNYYKE
ncbi:MAG: glycosyltransferase family 2 protein, partial [Desulfosarcina sp.]|nr:glycosyltransferase family 2 protein [Desulfobacterales bacterium]